MQPTILREREGHVRRRSVWVTLLVVALFASCSAPPRAVEANALEINEKYRETIEARQGEYRIKPGDVLSIEIYTPEQQDLDQSEIIVRPDGRGEIFFLPDHPLAGKTVATVREEFQSQLQAQVRDAAVSIQVRSGGEKVYLVGQFVEPGVVELSPDMTLGQAVSAVGGTRVTKSWALLSRPFEDPEKPELYKIEIGADENGTLVLLPGDQVLLGRNWAATFVTYWQEYILGLIDIRLVFGRRVE